MRQAKCSSCGSSVPLGSSFLINQQALCEPCANTAVEKLQAAKAPLQVTQPLDPTVCGKCSTDNGNSEFSRVAGFPLCGPCATAVYNVQFPAWIRFSLAGLLLLLVVALVQGRQWFSVGRSLVLGERLMERAEYAQAIPHLEAVQKAAPNSEKVLLPLGKAYLLTGRFQDGVRTLQQRPTYKDLILLGEVNSIIERVDQALGKVKQANDLAEQGKYAEAAKLMRVAKALYPQLPDIAEAEEAMLEADAFYTRDYDLFLKLTEDALQRDPKSVRSMGAYASALACKYAVTGDPAFRARAEEMLEKTRIAAQGDSQVLEAFAEHSERIRHRLESRQIIDRQEYDRRFRSNAGSQKPAR